MVHVSCVTCVQDDSASPSESTTPHDSHRSFVPQSQSQSQSQPQPQHAAHPHLNGDAQHEIDNLRQALQMAEERNLMITKEYQELLRQAREEKQNNHQVENNSAHEEIITLQNMHKSQVTQLRNEIETLQTRIHELETTSSSHAHHDSSLPTPSHDISLDTQRIHEMEMEIAQHKTTIHHLEMELQQTQTENKTWEAKYQHQHDDMIRAKKTWEDEMKQAKHQWDEEMKHARITWEQQHQATYQQEKMEWEESSRIRREAEIGEERVAWERKVKQLQQQIEQSMEKEERK